MSVGCAEQSNCMSVIVMNTIYFVQERTNIFTVFISLTVSLDQLLFACLSVQTLLTLKLLGTATWSKLGPFMTVGMGWLVTLA